MKVLLLLFALILAGCTTGQPVGDGGRVRYYHDPDHHVSCWAVYGGVSCLPDSQVVAP